MRGGGCYEANDRGSGRSVHDSLSRRLMYGKFYHHGGPPYASMSITYVSGYERLPLSQSVNLIPSGFIPSVGSSSQCRTGKQEYRFASLCHYLLTELIVIDR